MNIERLREFIIESNKKGYASGNTGVKEADGSNTIIYESGDWKSHDNYFGGEPYGGRVVVLFKGKPFWIMTYYGSVQKGIDHGEIYPFLKEVLLEIPEELPLRGPKNFKKGNLEYKFNPAGDLSFFTGEEKIFKNGKEVYSAAFAGGLVDQR